MADEFRAEDIVVLQGLEPVRRRAAMYVGDLTDGSGLHQLIFELVDSSTEEALDGDCRTIEVTLHADGSVTVSDDGPGLSVERVAGYERPALELYFTTMSHVRSSMERRRTTTGLGLAVVNALSERLTVSSWRDGSLHRQEHRRGEPLAPVSSSPSTDPKRRGTSITILPDPSIFPSVELSFERLSERLELVAHTVSVVVSLTDERTGRHVRFDGDLAAWVSSLAAPRRPLHGTPIRLERRDGDVGVEVALQWTEAGVEHVRGFSNGRFGMQAGTHLTGLRRGITRAFRSWTKAEPSSRALTEGLVAVVSLWHPLAGYVDVSRTRVTAPEIGTLVAQVVATGLREWLEAHPVEARAIVTRTRLGDAERAHARRVAELEAHLRASPGDGEAALVLGDLLVGDDDPRGELILLEHALATSGEASVEDELAALLASEGPRLWGKPGGFPFRDRWLGRSFISYEPTRVQRVRGASGAPLYARVRRFIEEMTDSAGPEAITVSEWRSLEAALPALGYAANGGTWRRSAPTPIHDELAALVDTWPVSGNPRLHLAYRFRLVDPERKRLFPFQRAPIYPGRDGLESSLAIHLDDQRILRLVLRFPIEEFGDELARCCRLVVDRLGPCLGRHGFRLHTPSPRGDAMISRRTGVATSRGGRGARGRR